MSPLIAFLIVFVLLLIALIKLKVTPSVGLFAAAIIFGLMVGMLSCGYSEQAARRLRQYDDEHRPPHRVRQHLR